MHHKALYDVLVAVIAVVLGFFDNFLCVLVCCRRSGRFVHGFYVAGVFFVLHATILEPEENVLL